MSNASHRDAVTTQEKFLGALLGVAVGDALGAPLEGRVPIGSIDVSRLMAGYRHIPGYPLGQVTDDTQLTLAMARAIIQTHAIDGSSIASEYAKLYKNNELVGAGQACSYALSNIVNGGIPWDRAGAPPGNAGNGAAMRAAPIGLWHFDEADRIPESSRVDGSITHKDERAMAGSAAVAAAIAYNVSHGELSVPAFVHMVAGAASRISSEFADEITHLLYLITVGEDEAVDYICRLGQFGKFQGTWQGRITAYVVPTVMIALYWFLRFPEDYRQAVGSTILTGGDVDTTGAICGGISGAFNGLSAIPRHLADQVLHAAQLRSVGIELHNLKCT